MFSGIIGLRGSVISNDPLPEGGARLRVRWADVADEEVAAKDSVAIDGVCLTATDVRSEDIAFDVVPETLARSTLGSLAAGDDVNVELALRVGDRIGGHFVYGHVDASVTVLTRTQEGQGARVRFERPPALAFALVDKAFVALDGVSLTVAAADDGWFEVALVPETLTRTTLGKRRPGTRVNLEIDPLARYAVQRRP